MMRALRWVLGLTFLVIVVGSFMGKAPTLEGATQAAPVAAPKPPANPAQEAAFQKAIMLAKAVKLSANDPDSIEVFEAFYLGDGTVVIKFRGRNAFNAKIANVAIWTGDGKHSVSGSAQQVAKVWNKYVAGKPNTDISSSMQGAKLLHAY